MNDVTFGEAPSGAALVQGTTVHEGQRYAKTSGTSFRHGGRTAEDAQEAGLRYAKEEMTRLANSMLISTLVDRSFRLYTIARVHHFHRPVLESVAICLYIVCRQTKGNTTLLIDFAEKIRQNVFDLGSVYKKFVRAIGLEADLERIPIIEIEPLLYKFAKRLEFGQYTRQVANDAALILSRMERDWMVTGRQPPALCGAAIILAARMNNFRRSVREVVYIVKAGDATVMKRLWEFRRTRAGQMTVSQFRQYSHRLKHTMDPPSLYLAKEAESRAEELRKRTEGEATPDSPEASSSAHETPRRDEDGFVIPNRPSSKGKGRPKKRAAPIDTPDAEDPAGDDDTSSLIAEDGDSPRATPARKRQKRSESVVPFILTPEDLRAEDELEDQIIAVVERHIHTDDAFDAALVRARAIADVERSRQQARNVMDGEVIDADEFEDDPEVANCLLSLEEVEVKEKIWVTHNHDWLRLQQERHLDTLMEAAMGKKKRTQKRKSRQSSIANDSPASTPAEASQRMLARKNTRPAFSRHINYEKLKKIYNLPDQDGKSSSGSTGSRAGSEVPSVVEDTAPAADEDVDDEDMDDVEEEDAEAGADDYDERSDDFEDADEEVDLDEIALEGNEFED